MDYYTFKDSEGDQRTVYRHSGNGEPGSFLSELAIELLRLAEECLLWKRRAVRLADRLNTPALEELTQLYDAYVETVEFTRPYMTDSLRAIRTALQEANLWTRRIHGQGGTGDSAVAAIKSLVSLQSELISRLGLDREAIDREGLPVGNEILKALDEKLAELAQLSNRGTLDWEWRASIGGGIHCSDGAPHKPPAIQGSIFCERCGTRLILHFL